jgi:NCAIR mutase (PurE)-related protein
MDKSQILDLLNGVKQGSVTPEQAALKLKLQPFEDLGYAKIDHHRQIRQGAGEVIYGQNKTPEQVVNIVKRMLDNGASDILITRMKDDAAALLAETVDYEYHPIPRVGIVNRTADRSLVGSVVVASAGTSDMAVCEEAALTAEVLGSRVNRLYDVGVAGLHRLLNRLDDIMQARVIIAVAGMEGALASVIGGLVDCPVIAVPTSVGYGANFGGLSALLSMLNSCASGVSVVNIDNGFGAGFLANRINRMEGPK